MFCYCPLYFVISFLCFPGHNYMYIYIYIYTHTEAIFQNIELRHTLMKIHVLIEFLMSFAKIILCFFINFFLKPHISPAILLGAQVSSSPSPLIAPRGRLFYYCVEVWRKAFQAHVLRASQAGLPNS